MPPQAPATPVQAPPQPIAQPRQAVTKVPVPLIVQYGPTLRSYKELPVVIGKHPGCDFVLNHPALADQHAQIFFSQGQYWVKDLTGQRRVTVNGAAVGYEAPLQPNDLLSLAAPGPAFRFLGEGRLAEYEEIPPEESPAPPEPQAPAKKPKASRSIFDVFKK